MNVLTKSWGHRTINTHPGGDAGHIRSPSPTSWPQNNQPVNEGGFGSVGELSVSGEGQRMGPHLISQYRRTRDGPMRRNFRNGHS